MIGDRFLTKKEFDLFVKNLNLRLSGLSIIEITPEDPAFILGEFLALIDTPAAYANHAKKLVRVNAAESALEFDNTFGAFEIDGNEDAQPVEDAFIDEDFEEDANGDIMPRGPLFAIDDNNDLVSV